MQIRQSQKYNHTNTGDGDYKCEISHQKDYLFGSANCLKN